MDRVIIINYRPNDPACNKNARSDDYDGLLDYALRFKPSEYDDAFSHGGYLVVNENLINMIRRCWLRGAYDDENGKRPRLLLWFKGEEYEFNDTADLALWPKGFMTTTGRIMQELLREQIRVRKENRDGS